MSLDANGQIVTFYSYKGGTGRTMALANVAWILASNGLRVLAVDWDLESPGLHRFFHPFLDEDILAATPGVIELISDYEWIAASQEPRKDTWLADCARILPHAVSLEWEFPEPGTLDFVSAGRQNRDYSAALSAINWDNFYDRLGGGLFFDALRADMKSNYDYVLIDSRTGLNDIADICTIQLPDILVDCFTLNNQSIEGAAEVAQHIEARYHERQIHILPVPMRIEDNEKEKLDISRVVARERFARFPTGLTPERMAQYWGLVEIPYRPYYAFEETLATFGDDPGLPTSLLAAFERLTNVMTDGRCPSLPPMAEETRLRYRQAFARRTPVALANAFISYAPEDRLWADWVEHTLSRSGFRVFAHSASAGPAGDAETDAERDLAAATHIVVVLSAAYMRSAQARATWETLSSAAQLRSVGHLVPARIDDARLAAQFADQNPVELTGLDQERAAGALLRALDRPVPRFERSVQGAQSGPRFPGVAPAIWNVPPRNVDFTGRNDILERLRDQLLEGGPAVVLAQALYGLGGVGKTQIALEYAHRFMADYDLAWWVPAEGSDEIVSALAELAARLGIPVGDNLVEGAQAALEALRRGHAAHRWLLIFDNADDPDELQPYLPTGPGHVLFTSRNQNWSQLAKPFEVDVFDREESIAHLQLHLPGLDRPAANQIADRLGDLPLAIEQAGAWLRETGMPASSYLEELEAHTLRVLSLNQPSGYAAPVVATWNMSLARLGETSAAAVRLLQLCAFCSPGPISMSLLYSDDMIQALLPYDETLVERVILGRVIRQISRFALAKVDQGNNSIYIHRLVQAVIRAQMSEEEQHEARHQVHMILVGARPRRGETDDPGNWSRYGWIWPHLMPSLAAQCDDERTRQLLIDRVRYLWLRSELDLGLQLAGQLEAQWMKKLGPNHRQTLHLRFHKANLLRSQGRFADARMINEDVLARQRAELPPDHPHTLMTAGGLAADLRALGDFQQALAMDQDTYNRLKEQFGDDHARTLAMANNLAVSYRLVGDCFTARGIDRETLDRRRLVLGHDHPFTLFSAANLAIDLREAGHYRESADLLRSTYERYREILGDQAIATLRTAKSLAISLRKGGAHREAKRLTEETYDRYLAHYGKDSPDALSCALNLACDYSALDDKWRARDLVAKVRSAYQETLGADHPYTLIAANNLVTYLRGTNSVADAVTLARETLAAMRRRLGAEHPYALSCAVNAANCLADDGQLEAAEVQLRQTAQRLRDRLGSRHPDTLVCDANLAVVLRQLGRDSEAEQLRARVLKDLGQVLGEHHPDTDRLRHWRRSNRDLEPQPT